MLVQYTLITSKFCGSKRLSEDPVKCSYAGDCGQPAVSTFHTSIGGPLFSLKRKPDWKRPSPSSSIPLLSSFWTSWAIIYYHHLYCFSSSSPPTGTGL
ncbi:hypothetical protein IF1G_07942 [Cordyceps javanica]|uniref:Uncharacterized protein n=1 Tax=Cordyceps javanica TaxID=43265 RepID=A0A545UV71_9HYPO|nr:hypothetical protein IF1G_07942 [Cordyceps javanica]